MAPLESIRAAIRRVFKIVQIGSTGRCLLRGIFSFPLCRRFVNPDVRLVSPSGAAHITLLLARRGCGHTSPQGRLVAVIGAPTRILFQFRRIRRQS